MVMNVASREDVVEMIDRLLSGRITREEASLWAGVLHVEESEDPVVEEALDILTLIDGREVDAEGNPTGFLFDFKELESIRRALGDVVEDG
jgi:hypothetical protein